jgi:hypothetical protein
MRTVGKETHIPISDTLGKLKTRPLHRTINSPGRQNSQFTSLNILHPITMPPKKTLNKGKGRAQTTPNPTTAHTSPPTNPSTPTDTMNDTPTPHFFNYLKSQPVASTSRAKNINIPHIDLYNPQITTAQPSGRLPTSLPHIATIEEQYSRDPSEARSDQSIHTNLTQTRTTPNSQFPAPFNHINSSHSNQHPDTQSQLSAFSNNPTTNTNRPSEQKSKSDHSYSKRRIRHRPDHYSDEGKSTYSHVTYLHFTSTLYPTSLHFKPSFQFSNLTGHSPRFTLYNSTAYSLHSTLYNSTLKSPRVQSYLKFPSFTSHSYPTQITSLTPISTLRTPTSPYKPSPER